MGISRINLDRNLSGVKYVGSKVADWQALLNQLFGIPDHKSNSIKTNAIHFATTSQPLLQYYGCVLARTSHHCFI